MTVFECLFFDFFHAWQFSSCQDCPGSCPADATNAADAVAAKQGDLDTDMLSFVIAAHGQSTQELAFTTHNPKEPGDKLLRWGAPDWNQGNVNTKKGSESQEEQGQEERCLDC